MEPVQNHIRRTRDVIADAYDNWCAVAGFFDGDGGLDVEVRKNTIHWVINFTDNWAPQLLQIKKFLESRNIRVGAIRSTGMGAYKVEVAAIESLTRFALEVVATKCLFKKREEMKTMLDYFGGEITGDQVIEFLNEEVRSGVRVGKLRTCKVPYTYQEGLRVYKKGYKRIGPSTLQALTETEKDEVRRKYVTEGLTMYQLAPLFQVSPSTIFKTIRGLKRGSGLGIPSN